MVARLQVKASQIGRLLQTLESKSNSDEKKTANAQTLCKQKSESSGPPMKKPHYIDPIPPFNANKIRKSPSVSLSCDTATKTTNETTSPNISDKKNDKKTLSNQ